MIFTFISQSSALLAPYFSFYTKQILLKKTSSASHSGPLSSTFNQATRRFLGSMKDKDEVGVVAIVWSLSHG